MYAMDFNKQVAIREETKVVKFKMMSFPGRTKTLSIFSSSNQYINRDKIKKLYVMSTTAVCFWRELYQYFVIVSKYFVSLRCLRKRQINLYIG